MNVPHSQASWHRDFNAKGFNSDKIKKIIVEEMIKLGLNDELARKNASTW
ncbi:hypothetical protein ACFSTH_11390 [Paenibacillus yanchengensis]|uniref:Uncharacterized protein n=1 Tax=Paenibacillus yanchengensis TaxID=2035833 RepID=A0ABW4YJZ5_9BACL